MSVVSGVLAIDSALAVRGHEFGFAVGWGVLDGKPEREVCSSGCKAGIPGSGKGQFSVPVGVAANEASGDFYVLDEANGRVERFSAAGEYLGEFDGSGIFEVEGKENVGEKPESGKLLKPKTIAVDNSCAQRHLTEAECEAKDPSANDVYITASNIEDPSHDVIDKFTPAGDYVGQVQVPLAKPKEEGHLEIMAVAVDSNGNLWVSEDQGVFHRGFDEFDDLKANEHMQFVEVGERFRREHPGLAVAADNGSLYAVIAFELPFEEVVSRYKSSGRELGVVFRRQSRGVAVDSVSGDVYVDAVGSVARFTAGIPALALEEFGEGDLVKGQGIGIDAVLIPGVHEREKPVYVADAGAARVVVFPLEEPKTPTVESISVSSVTSGSATLRAVVNPRGARSEYRFEYSACSSPSSCASTPFEATVPVGEGFIGARFDFEGHELSVHLQNLQAGATYHFRVVARNEKTPPEKVVESSEVVFRTQPAVRVEPLLDSRSWEMVSPPHKHGTRIKPIFTGTVIQAAVGGDAFTYATDSPTEDEPRGYSNIVQVLSRRTKVGWASEDLALSHSRATTVSVGQGGEYRWFSEDLSVALVQPFGQFESTTSPEATEQTPYVRTDFTNDNVEAPCSVGCYRPVVTADNVKEGVRFGNEGVCPPRLICGPVIAGASPDGQHIVISSSAVGLTELSGDKGGLYEWIDGTLSMLSVLPGGQVAAPASTPTLGADEVTRGAVSSDGSRVVWSETAGKGNLYLRDVTDNQTIELNKGLVGAALFQDASADGSQIFFSDSGNLYVYEAETGETVRLTKPISGEEETEVEGKIAGVSEDGKYVYFVANGRLSTEAPPVEHTCGQARSEAGRCYLYVMHKNGGVWEAPRVIAVLSGADNPDFARRLHDLTTRVSPDGRWITFMSQLPLTKYDNRDAVSGARDEEVYLYDSLSNNLVCVSCKPTGARPTGVEARVSGRDLPSGQGMWASETWLAANVPGWTSYEIVKAFYQSRYLLDDGRVFFDSSDALVPRDVNGTEDVYEYEPEGIGSCTSASASFVEPSSGCVDLVSAGTSRAESVFLDASTSGSDVFFLTASKLMASDFDSAYDVYDAHECGPLAPCLPEPITPPLVCVAEASCKSTPTPQPDLFGAPPSATFSGLGNVPSLLVPARSSSHGHLLSGALASCRREHQRSRKQRSSCERRARARFATRDSGGSTRRG